MTQSIKVCDILEGQKVTVYEDLKAYLWNDRE